MRIREPQLAEPGRQGRTTEEWETLLGSQFRAVRIARGLDQSELAESAGVSIGAVRNLERGAGSSLRTLLRVVRALGREDWLESLAPTVSVSPLDLVRAKRSERTRVYRPRERS